MQFTQITEDQLPKRTRANSASGDLLKNFVESGIELAKLEDLGDRKVASVRSTLTTYIKTHSIPVKVVTVGDELFLKRAQTGVPADVDAEIEPVGDVDEVPAEG